MPYRSTNRWLDKTQYNRIRYKAKKMGATDICLKYISHSVRFGKVIVFFAFKPFQCGGNVAQGSLWKDNFFDEAGANAIKADIDKALEFMNYLKEFNKEVENTNQ